jgi:L-malate glycosyltransferase
MRVLYVNHTAEVSGAERSLLDLLSTLPGTIEPRVAAPAGRLTQEVARLGIPVTTIAGTAGSLRLHPLHTPRALAEMSLAAAQVHRAARRHRVDVVHANSIRAGIVLALARLSPTATMPAATIAHVRDCLPPGAVATTTLRVVGSGATTVLANSHYTARSVLAAAPKTDVEVVHNPVDLARWDPGRIERERVRDGLGESFGEAGGQKLLLGVVAQLSPWKGQDTAIEALKLLCEQRIDAHLLLVGSAKFVDRATRFDNQGYVARLHRLVAEAGLEDRVSWLGERDDVPELVCALDMLLLPSWEEPFGRALIEAMAMRVPVVATSVGGPPEIVTDGCEGLLVRPRDPRGWARAIHKLAEDPGLRASMGQAGRLRVLNQFSAQHHARAVLAVYERAVA